MAADLLGEVWDAGKRAGVRGVTFTVCARTRPNWSLFQKKNRHHHVSIDIRPDCRAPVLRHACASDAPLCGVRRRRCRRRLWRIGGRLAAPITAAGPGFGPYRGINFDKCCADTPVHRTRACAAASPCGGGAPSECCNLVQMGARACAHTDTLPDASASEWGHTNLDIFWGWAQTRARAAHVDCRRALHLIKNLSISPQNIVCVFGFFLWVCGAQHLEHSSLMVCITVLHTFI